MITETASKVQKILSSPCIQARQDFENETGGSTDKDTHTHTPVHTHTNTYTQTHVAD